MADSNTVQNSVSNFEICGQLWDMAYTIKSQALRTKFPEKTDGEIHAMTIDMIEKGCK